MSTFYMPTRIFAEENAIKKHAGDLASFGKKALKPAAGSGKKGDIFDRILRFSHRLATERPKATVAAFCAVMAFTFAGFLQLKVESDSNKLVFKGLPLRDTLDMVDERIKATGFATLKYYYTITRQPTEWPQEKWCWRSMDGATIVQTSSGGYVLRMPKLEEV